MQDLIFEMLRNINIAQLLAIGGIFWFFYARLNGNIEKLEARMDAKMEKMEARIEKSEANLTDKIGNLDRSINKLNEKVEDIDRRLCRIEGSLATQGHCLFNQAKPEQKAV